ncbi:Methyltransferase domain-containing protein [Spironucleus salmonicida]|uniref:Methyltransferase domain-containing protein n=1 Tax=Spironucleus salmonicida TaxID=348837 RepID=V6LDA4_9EUKA|nr:Methyltransferase domain-containing protein [Spironucleus salmonicida]|eukprot:EST42485.1 hypothetical protein SS50377_17791 [Spironucleus salmonicida]
MFSLFPGYKYDINVTDKLFAQYISDLNEFFKIYSFQLLTFHTDLLDIQFSDEMLELEILFTNKELYRKILFDNDFSDFPDNKFLNMINKLILPKQTSTPCEITSYSTTQHQISADKAQQILQIDKFLGRQNLYGQGQIFVEIGAGKGYVSSFLAYDKNEKVVAIEASLKHSRSFLQRNMGFLKRFYGKTYSSIFDQKFIQNKPSQVLINQIYNNINFCASFVDIDTSINNILNNAVNLKELQQQMDQIDYNITDNHQDTKFIQGAVGEKITGDQPVTNTIIIGLHACGNLSPTLLSFKSQCRAVITIPCCYSHLDQKYFPLTEDVSAVLELIKDTRYTQFRHKSYDLPRHFFTQDGFVDFEVAQQQVISFMGKNIQSLRKYQTHVLIRQFLGQIVESLILTDRLIYYKAKIDFGLHDISGRGYIQWIG